MELLTYYYRWGTTGGQTGIWTHSGGVDTLVTSLNPLPFARTFNPFTSTVYIRGTCLYMNDAGSAPNTWYALQRNSDYAMIRVDFMSTGMGGGVQILPADCSIRLDPTDLLLEENGALTQNRSYGVTIFYTTTA